MVTSARMSEGEPLNFWRWMGVICAIYLVLGVIYGVVTPPFESSDEYKHYPVVHFVQNERKLVVLDAENPGKWAQDGAQPPLYYVIMAGLTSWIDTSDLDEVYDFNENAFIGDPNQILNKNLMIPPEGGWPTLQNLEGAVLALYVARFASVLIGVGTVICGANLGRAIFDETAGVLTGAFIAFLPMFLFTSGAVNNDSLANFLGALGLLQLVLLWQSYGRRDAETQRIEWRRLVVVGFVLGLGMITKLSLFGLLALAGIMMMVLAWRQKRWQTLFIDGVLIAGIAFGMAAPMMWSNWQNYGDITGLNVFIDVQGVREARLTPSGFYGELGTFYRSFWGLFGGVNVAMPEWLYSIYNVLFGIGVFLTVRRVFKSKETKGFWLVAGWVALVFGLLLRWVVIYFSFQGRLLFVALAGVAVIWAGGFGWLSQRWLRVLVGGMALVALGVALFFIRPSYTPPTLLTSIPLENEFGPITFGSELSLIGVNFVENQETDLGAVNDPIELEVFWRAEKDIERDYLSSVTLLGRDLDSIASVNRVPAWGMIPTSRWEAGQIWSDTYRLFVKGDVDSPNTLLVNVEIYNPEQAQKLPATDPDGNPIPLVTVGGAVLRGNSLTTKPAVSLNNDFEGIRLLGYTMPESVRTGETISLDLFWQSLSSVERDFTVFVQLLDDGVIASGDAPPLSTPNVADNFPTSLWQRGDTIMGTHSLAVSPDIREGVYRIAVGLYDGDYRLPLKSGGDAVIWEIQILE